jgi:hypothetical protein
MAVFWAIMNDCNGPFEVWPRRAQAQSNFGPEYRAAGCYIAPVVVEKMDEESAWYEERYEDMRERSDLEIARKDIVAAIRARGGR